MSCESGGSGLGVKENGIRERMCLNAQLLRVEQFAWNIAQIIDYFFRYFEYSPFAKPWQPTYWVFRFQFVSLAVAVEATFECSIALRTNADLWAIVAAT